MQRLPINQNGSYIDSDVEWIGNVPQDWETRRGKFLMLSKKELNTGMACDNVLSLTMNGVLHRDELGEGGLLPSDYSTFQIFYANDLVFKLIDLENYKTSRVGIVGEKGIMSSAYIRVFSQNKYFYPKYFYYFYFNLYLQGIFNFIGMGVRSTMNSKDLLELQVIIPPYKTQQKIADFLDEKTAKIDQIIAKKQKLIELLKEKRISIITQAVTKGLDPKAKMKPSGVEWIGDIPEGWKTKKARFIFKEMKRDPKDDDEIITAFRDGTVTLRKNRREEGFTNALKEIGYQRILKGDLVIHAMDAFAGAIGVSDSTGKGSPVYSACTLLFPAEIKYFGSLIRSIALSGYISSISRGIRVRSTDFRFVQFKNIELVIPSITEQKQIINFIDRNTMIINKLVKTTEVQLEKFKEYRSSLIYNSVTGKINI